MDDQGTTAIDPLAARRQEPERPVHVPTSAADTAAARARIEAVIGESDGGHLSKHWPEQYEPAIAAVLGALKPGEQVRAGWRIRNAARHRQVHDVGVLVVTDRQVLGADHCAKAHGMFALPAETVAGVAVSRSMSAGPMNELHLLGQDERVLGGDDSPATVSVFGEGLDPSRWDVHLRGPEDLQKVRDQLVALLPAASVGSGATLNALADASQSGNVARQLLTARALQEAGDPRAVDALVRILVTRPESRGAQFLVQGRLQAWNHARLEAMKDLQAHYGGVPERAAVAALMLSAGEPILSGRLVEALTASGGPLAAPAFAAMRSFGWRLTPTLADAVSRGLTAVGDAAVTEPGPGTRRQRWSTGSSSRCRGSSTCRSGNSPRWPSSSPTSPPESRPAREPPRPCSAECY